MIRNVFLHNEIDLFNLRTKLHIQEKVQYKQSSSGKTGWHVLSGTHWSPVQWTTIRRPSFPNRYHMVKAISKMKLGKTAGPSGIVVEMIMAAGDTGVTMIRCLNSAIIHDGKVPADSD